MLRNTWPAAGRWSRASWPMRGRRVTPAYPLSWRQISVPRETVNSSEAGPVRWWSAPSGEVGWNGGPVLQLCQGRDDFPSNQLEDTLLMSVWDRAVDPGDPDRSERAKAGQRFSRCLGAAGPVAADNETGVDRFLDCLVGSPLPRAVLAQYLKLVTYCIYTIPGRYVADIGVAGDKA